MIFTWFLHDFQGRWSQKGASVLFIGTEERALAAMLGLWFMHVAFCLCCTCIYRDNTRLAPGYMWRNYTTCNYAAYNQLQWQWATCRCTQTQGVARCYSLKHRRQNWKAQAAWRLEFAVDQQTKRPVYCRRVVGYVHCNTARWWVSTCESKTWEWEHEEIYP